MQRIWLTACLVVSWALNFSAQEELPPLPEMTWNRLAKGIFVGRLTLDSPRPLRLVVAKIDLQKEIDIVVTPSNGEAHQETKGRTTSTFLREFHCLLAINAGPFQPVLPVEGGNHDVRGLQIANGKIVSPDDVDCPVLVFDANHRAEILNRAPQSTVSISHAIPGFRIVLDDGNVLPPRPGKRDQELHPRTCVGTSANGNRLYLCVVDGRQPGRSEGISLSELGTLMKQLGCTDALNLDGGGTSTMVMRDATAGSQVLNRPIHGNIPGWERPSGSHLGFRPHAESAPTSDGNKQGS